MKPLVSLIVPVYNVAPYITSCLESLVEQDYPNKEIILVDDRGTDDSVAIAQSFLSSSRIEYKVICHKENSGVSVARNTGLLAASGEYVLFVDSDDVLEPDCVSSLVSCVHSRQFDVVVGSYRTVGRVTSETVLKDGEYVTNDEVMECFAQGGWYYMPWNKLCKKEFLISNNLLFLEGLALHEDFLWTYQTACVAHSVAVSSHITYSYRVNADSAMSKASIEKDLCAYIPALKMMSEYSRALSGVINTWQYLVIEGKKCGILYSLLQIGRSDLYEKYYSAFHDIVSENPINAWRHRIIKLPYLVRDLDICLPTSVGKVYKKLFYIILYKMWDAKIEGALWQ